MRWHESTHARKKAHLVYATAGDDGAKSMRTGCGRDGVALGLEPDPAATAPDGGCGSCKSAAAAMRTITEWTDALCEKAPGAIEWVGSRDSRYAMPLAEMLEHFGDEWAYLHPYTQRPQPACLPIDLVFVGADFWLEPTFYGWELVANCAPMGWKNPPRAFHLLVGPGGSRLADLNGESPPVRPVIARPFAVWEVASE